MCRTLAGNACEWLAISNWSDAQLRRPLRLERMFERRGSGSPKRAVVLSARVHPGETNASYIMQGLLRALTAANDIAHELREESAALEGAPSPVSGARSAERAAAVGTCLSWCRC